MASEHIADDSPVNMPTVEEEPAIARALADITAGRTVEGVSTEALARFCALDEADARRLLGHMEELRAWFAAQA